MTDSLVFSTLKFYFNNVLLKLSTTSFPHFPRKFKSLTLYIDPVTLSPALRTKRKSNAKDFHDL